MKRLSNLQGFVALSRSQQSIIFGGDDPFSPGGGGGSGICQSACSSDSDCNSDGTSPNPYCNEYVCEGATIKVCSAT